MAIMSCLSVLAKCITSPPILLAIPVSNKAPPTINIATNKITLLSIKPEKASLIVKTFVKTKPTHTIIEVTLKGIFSVTNITIANNKKIKVIEDALIIIPRLIKLFVN